MASALETPCATRPVWSACGSFEASPTIISVKKTPIESTLAEFIEVASIPAPAPRCDGGRLFITPALFGEAEEPHADPVQQQDQPEPDVAEVDRQQRSGVAKLSAASTIPPVAKGRAPKRSERYPEAGPAIRKPAISGVM